MYVLREVHKSLRRNGILLDFHPQPEDPPVEVVHTSGTQEVGRIDWTQDGREIRRARRRLSALEAEGLFRLERRMYFDLSMYHDSVDAWLEHRRQKEETDVLTEDLLRSARKAMRRKGAQIVVRERIRASSLRRI